MCLRAAAKWGDICDSWQRTVDRNRLCHFDVDPCLCLGFIPCSRLCGGKWKGVSANEQQTAGDEKNQRVWFSKKKQPGFRRLSSSYEIFQDYFFNACLKRVFLQITVFHLLSPADIPGCTSRQALWTLISTVWKKLWWISSLTTSGFITWGKKTSLTLNRHPGLPQLLRRGVKAVNWRQRCDGRGFPVRPSVLAWHGPGHTSTLAA